MSDEKGLDEKLVSTVNCDSALLRGHVTGCDDAVCDSNDELAATVNGQGFLTGCIYRAAESNLGKSRNGDLDREAHSRSCFEEL